MLASPAWDMNRQFGSHRASCSWQGKNSRFQGSVGVVLGWERQLLCEGKRSEVAVRGRQEESTLALGSEGESRCKDCGLTR
jgi:hypothetical protein